MRKALFVIVCLAAVFLVSVLFLQQDNMNDGDMNKTEHNGRIERDIAAVIDTHSDTLLNIIDSETWLPTVDIGKATSFQIDIPKLRQGGVDVQYFAAFTSGYYVDNKPDYLKANSRLLALMNALYWTLSKNPEHIGLARTVEDIESLIGQHRISAVLSIEGAYSLEPENGLELLEQYYDLGVRSIALTWNYSNALGEGAGRSYMDGTQSDGGLTEFGKQVVKRMNDLGIIIDVSHLSEQTFWDVLNASDLPVIASHSAAYGLRNHVRNLKDEQMIALAKAGGVIHAVFYPGFLAYDADTVTVKTLVDHIDYMVNLVGVEHVGLGSDFDGASMPHDLRNASMLPNIERELSARGYSKAEVEMIFGKNTMRVMGKVWKGGLAKGDSGNGIIIKPNVHMGEAYTTEKQVLSAKIEPIPGICPGISSLRAILDGRVFSPEYDDHTGIVSLKLKEPLSEKFHVVTFEATCSDGTTTRATRIFFIP